MCTKSVQGIQLLCMNCNLRNCGGHKCLTRFRQLVFSSRTIQLSVIEFLNQTASFMFLVLLFQTSLRFVSLLISLNLRWFVHNNCSLHLAFRLIVFVNEPQTPLLRLFQPNKPCDFQFPYQVFSKINLACHIPHPYMQP